MFVYGSLIAPKESPFPGEAPAWSVALLLNELDSQPLFQLLEDIIQVQRKNDKKYPTDNSMLLLPWSPSTQKNASGTRTIIDGEYLWKFKRKSIVKKKDGTQERQTPPIIYDASGKVVNDTITNIGRGTTGKAIFTAYPYAAGKNIGISFQLKGFQIAALEAEDDSIELTPIAGGFVVDDAAPAPAAAPVDELEDF